MVNETAIAAVAKPQTPDESLDRFFELYKAEKIAAKAAKGTTGAQDRGLESTISKMQSAITVWRRIVGDEWPTKLNIATFREGAQREQSWGAEYVRQQETNIGRWKTWLRTEGIWVERVEFALTMPGEIGVAKRAEVKRETARKGGNEVDLKGLRLCAEDITAVAEKTTAKLYTMIFGGESSQDFWSVILRKLSHSLGPGNLAKALGIEPHVAESWIRNNRVPAQNRAGFHDAYVLLCSKQMMSRNDWDIDDLEDAIDDFSRFLLPEDEKW